MTLRPDTWVETPHGFIMARHVTVGQKVRVQGEDGRCGWSTVTEIGVARCGPDIRTASGSVVSGRPATGCTGQGSNDFLGALGGAY